MVRVVQVGRDGVGHTSHPFRVWNDRGLLSIFGETTDNFSAGPQFFV
jgi:hypothetical protein